ncbi:MAG: AraC family transcriptional regulator [Sandaracinaceae bacterium]|nr:AraC family transcriptional regulator [Sandaracinaceae bacterium]
MSGTVLSVASRAVLEACERLGLDGAELLARAGLSREEIEDPDRRVEAERADALWRHAYERAGDPCLALHAAEALPFGAYKVIDYLATHAPTAGAGLEQVAAYFPLIDPRARLVVEHGDPTRLRVELTAGGEVPAPAQEYTLAALVTRMRAVAPLPLQRVCFSFAAPEDAREHARIFRCEVRFGCAAPELVIAERDWGAPLRTRDPALAALLERHAAALLAELSARSELAERVRAAIAEMLRAREEPTLARVAKRLATSERTLQRRLREEEVTFAALADDARAGLARSYLRERDLSLAEVAFLLGFADQSTFTRAFRRWTGVAPGAFRAGATRA